MRRILLRFVWGVAPWASAMPLGAQEAPPAVARPGDRVRIWFGARKPRKGILRRVDAETVFVTLKAGGARGTPRVAIEEVEVFAGRTAGLGAKWGGGGGVPGTLVAGCTPGGA